MADTDQHITISFSDVPAEEARDLIHKLITAAQGTTNYHISCFPMTDIDDETN